MHCLVTFGARLLNMINYSQLPYYYGLAGFVQHAGEMNTTYHHASDVHN